MTANGRTAMTLSAPLRLRKRRVSLGWRRTTTEALVPLRAFLKGIGIVMGLLCAGAAVAEPAFVPVFKENFPDAFVLAQGDRFIAYSTNDGPNVPVATSADLVHWSFARDPATGKKRDALPKLGTWAKE